MLIKCRECNTWQSEGDYADTTWDEDGAIIPAKRCRICSTVYACTGDEWDDLEEMPAGTDPP